MIINFKDRATEELFHGIHSKLALRIPKDIWGVALRKLDMLNAASEMGDLRVPPANRLESLKGDLKGLYSIRVNDRFRVVFRWSEHNAYDVRIEDYH